MGLVDEIPTGSRILLDANAVVYFIERHPAFAPTVRPVFQGISRGLFTAVISVITLLEVLVAPLRADRPDLVAEYRRRLTGSKGLSLVPVSIALGEEAARIRAAYNLRTPDALVAATAATERCSHLIGNDPIFRRVPHFQTLLISEAPAT
ncbi:MAG: PIN domain-containing protein [Dehalococcoidia bacterium]|nr:PIN domain-containing protein [Dehalococcoidia bacterium]